MSLLNESVQKQVREVFAGMQAPVKLIFFTQGAETEGEAPSLECSMCADTRQLLEEVAGLSDNIQIEIYDFVKDKEIAEHYNIDKIPATVVLGGPDFKDHGIRLFGIPSGYEFSSLIEDIVLASRGKPELSQKTLDELKKLDKPVHIQVFITPT